MPSFRIIALCLTTLLAVAVPASASAKVTQFQSPTKNIGCIFASGFVRCDIGAKDWKAPKPKGCRTDYGNGLFVDLRGAKGRVVCAGDTVLGVGPVLAYGKSITRERLTCTSRRTGITCRTKAGHGFRISKESYRLF